MTTRKAFLFPAPRALFAAPCLLGLTMAAQAQEKPKQPAAGGEELQEVVVTGSRIARPDLDRLEPTMIVSATTFDDRGYLDVGQALTELPAFSVMPSSAANTQAGFGIAQSFVDLYGLGSQRTLVLINGRRFVSSSTASLNGAGGQYNPVGGPGQQVDLNVVPTKLIDRVETVSVGGAPIYGADAISGTVNIILKKDFQGVDLDAQVGVSNQEDAWNYRRARSRAELRRRTRQHYRRRRIQQDRRPGGYRAAGVFGGSWLSCTGRPGKIRYGADPKQLGAAAQPSAAFPWWMTYFFGPSLAFRIRRWASPMAPASSWRSATTAAMRSNPTTWARLPAIPIFSEGGDGLRLSQFSNLLSRDRARELRCAGNFKIMTM